MRKKQAEKVNSGLKYKFIVWDYNGTIIDDAWVAVAAENIVLKAHGNEINMDFYLRECEMPIRNFYDKIYDFSVCDFRQVADAFLENYDRISAEAKPFPEVCEAIRRFERLGLHQGVISGFETGRLTSSLEKFGLDGFFDFMSGADDVDCGSKSERAAAIVKKYGYDPKETLFIGDMYHDFETASRVGADCVLIAKGHQGAEVLKSYGDVAVLGSAYELSGIID